MVDIRVTHLGLEVLASVPDTNRYITHFAVEVLARTPAVASGGNGSMQAQPPRTGSIDEFGANAVVREVGWVDENHQPTADPSSTYVPGDRVVQGSSSGTAARATTASFGDVGDLFSAAVTLESPPATTTTSSGSRVQNVDPVPQASTATSTSSGTYIARSTPTAPQATTARLACFGTVTSAPVAFISPNPVVTEATASASHRLTLTVLTGPTTAGATLSWWEFELGSGNSEVYAQARFSATRTFDIAREIVEEVQIPYGMNLRKRRVRFVIVPSDDGSQTWRSPWFALADDANFDNSATPVSVTIPATSTTPAQVFTAPPQPAQVTRKTTRGSTPTLKLSNRSRYKFTRPFVDPASGRGVEFEPMSVIEEFTQRGSAARTHRVRATDIGALDKLACDYYGLGSERLWWVIAYANAIVDVENDMYVGQILAIPSADAVRRFVNRRPVQ